MYLTQCYQSKDVSCSREMSVTMMTAVMVSPQKKTLRNDTQLFELMTCILKQYNQQLVIALILICHGENCLIISRLCVIKSDCILCNVLQVLQ